MSKSRLYHASSAFNLRQQTLQVNMQVFVNIFHVHCKHRAQQDATESRGWVDRQIQMTQR
jgi:hypothetical protein